MSVLVNWAAAGKKTKNGRIYGKDLLQREIDRLQKSVEKGSMIGTADHSLDGFSNIKNASHIITELCMDEDGLCWAEMKILPTSMGKQIMTLIKNKAEIGVSQRGFGEVAKDGTVSDSFSLQGIDVVANPSYEGGVLSQDNIMESLDFEEKKEVDEEFISELQAQVYAQKMSFLPTSQSPVPYEEWLKKNGQVIRATALVEEFHQFDTIEEALISMGEEGVLREMKAEEKVHVWTEDEIFWEARTAGVSPKDFCRKLNEMEQRKMIDRNSGFSEKEAARLCEEATLAGVDMKDLEKRKAYLESLEKNRTPGELTIHEKAVAIQKKRLVEGKQEDLEFIKEVLRDKEKEAETQKKRMAVKAMVEGEILRSGAFVSREETHRHVNRELRKRNLAPLDEDGQ